MTPDSTPRLRLAQELEQQARADQAARALQRRSQARSLLLFALLALLALLVRAGLDRAFPAGWWRQW